MRTILLRAKLAHALSQVQDCTTSYLIKLSTAYRYLLFSDRLAVGNELLMLTLMEPFF